MGISDFLLLITASFACYRLAKLITWDNGPFDIFLKFRTRVGVYDYNEDLQPYTNLGKFFSCPYCVGIWVALVIVLLLYGAQMLVPLYWLAVAGLQSIYESWLDK